MNTKKNNNPVRIGYSLSLTGPVSENARSARLAHQIWEEDINLRGGLLGRRVELICADDHGDANLVQQIYIDLLDKEKADLVIGGYGTNTIGAAMPVVSAHKKFFIGLMGLGVNLTTQYERYFAMIPTGVNPNSALTEGFFALAASQIPKPETVALLFADAEFSKNPVAGARENAAKYEMEIIHEQKYSLSTQDFSSLIAGLKNINADVLFLCSYLQDSVGLVRAINAGDYNPKMVGGAMIGPQSASVKKELGALLNGFVNYEYWMPVPQMNFKGVADFLSRYRARALVEHADELGFYVAPPAYSQMQVLEQAVTESGSFDDDILSGYCKTHSFDTVMGNISFGESGEWIEPRVLQVQFQNFDYADIDTFKNGHGQVVVAPAEYASGSLNYPYISQVKI